MKKTLIAAALSVYCFGFLTAQESKNVAGQPIGGIAIKTRPGGINLSVSANGGSSPSGGVSNNLSFNPDLHLELFRGGLGIGLDAGIFTTQLNFDPDSYISPLKNMDMIAIGSARKSWKSMYFLAGPQYTFGNATAHKISFTISVEGGLGIYKAPSFTVIDMEMNQQPIAQYAAPSSYKQNAFVFKPGFAITYSLTEKFALRANAQYLLRTDQREFSTSYKDLTGVDFSQDNKKARVQMQGQPVVVTNTKGPGSYFSAGIGITYSIRKHAGGTTPSGKTISEKGVSSTKGRPRSRVFNDDDGLSDPERQARDKIKNVSIRVSGPDSRAGEIGLTGQQLDRLFTPLATGGFVYQSASIIRYADSGYLVAVFENKVTKMQERIGLPVHENNGSAFVSGGDKPIKCGFNIYCTCNPPLCLGCTRPGGTTVEQCGFAKSGTKQLAAYFSAFAELGAMIR